MKQATTILAALVAAALLGGCASGSSGSGLSKVAKTERNDCRLAILGGTKETMLRSYMQPDLTDHTGPITIDTYVDGKVILYYAQGVAIATDCGTGKVSRAKGITAIGRRYLGQATAIHEGSF